MQRLSGIWLALGLSWAVQAAEENTAIYYWTDANGVTHFSDRPVAGKPAQTMQVEISNPPVNNPNPVPETPTAAEPAVSSVSYTLSITSPLMEETIRDGEGKFTVSNQLTPALLPDDDAASLFIYVDSSRYPCDTATLICQVQDLDRGAHQLRTELIAKTGKVLASSETITIYLFRPRAIR